MARRSQFSFGTVPTIKHSRSKFDLSFHNKTSFNVGELVPFYVQEIVPGDTFKTDATFVSRVTSAFLKPVVDNLFLDTYYFFVPNRLVYDKWKQVMGENDESAWAQQKTYSVPTVPTDAVPVASGSANVCVNSSKSVGDYMGLPVGNLPAGLSLLPFRAFALIYDEWFRDENLIDPMLIQKGEASRSEILNDDPWSSSNYTGRLPKVAKLHDYFTSALPAPQKGESVPIAIGSSAEVVNPMQYSNGEVPVYTSGINGIQGDVLNNDSFDTLKVATSSVRNGQSLYPFVNNIESSFGSVLMDQADVNTGETLGPSGLVQRFKPLNLVSPAGSYADLSNATGASVNDLRFAFQLQKMLEKDARGGTRYVEYLKSHFGVNAPDARLNRTEFLGGKRNPISIQQVNQTSQPTDSSPLGAVGAFSLSSGSARYNKGFVEHGFVIGVMCIRQFHTYQQGIDKMWFRKDRNDFYDPLYANLGEQPVYTSQIFGVQPPNTQGSPVLRGNIFGYNEAWADMRYKPSYITGQMRTGVASSLDIWHFGDFYNSAPTLSKTFVEETSHYVDRSLAVPSTSQDQFLVDIYVKNVAYRPMPTYSVPGLIDHH